MKYIKILFPVLFIFYLGGIISFTHVHIINGITIVHSHPFQKSGEDPLQQHQHTGTELQLLHQISTILHAGNIVSYIVIAALLLSLLFINTRPVEYCYLRPVNKTNQLRAPPFFA